jgi:hypothetical protein
METSSVVGTAVSSGGGVHRGEMRHTGGATSGEAGDGRIVPAKMGESVPIAKEESCRISAGALVDCSSPRSPCRKRHRPAWGRAVTGAREVSVP